MKDGVQGSDNEKIGSSSSLKAYQIQGANFSRRHLYMLLGLCILLPFLILGFYLKIDLSTEESRELLLVSCLSFFTSSLLAVYFLKEWEKKIKRSAASIIRKKIQVNHTPEIQDYENQIKKLIEQIDGERKRYEYQIDLLQSSIEKNKEQAVEFNLSKDKTIEEMRHTYFEYEDLRKEYQRLEEEFALFHEESIERLKHKETILEDYQKTISEQRAIIEKKQMYISRLEGKVRDLMYEIRSLLQLGDSAHSHDPLGHFLPAHSSLDKATSFDLTLQLQRYIEKAESFTGAEHLGYVGGKTPRFLDVSRESYAIDLRRLFDFFREETVGIVFVYSSLERKFLFVNNHIKKTLGWSPEKFIKDFPHLLQTEYSNWQQALYETTENKKQIRVILRNRSGEDLTFNCLMQSVSKGPFTRNIIGILISA